MTPDYYLRRAARPHGDYAELNTPEAKGRPLYDAHDCPPRPRLTPEQIATRVTDTLCSRRRFTDGVKLAREVGADVMELMPVLSQLEAAGVVLSGVAGYRLAPRPTPERVKKLRAEAKAAHRFRKEFYVTDAEHLLLKKHLLALRGEHVE